MADITWTNDTATLGELVPWERNPKRISKAHAERLLAYWRKIGQFQSIAIGPDGEVYDGHQRLSVLMAAFGKGYQVDVRRASRALTEAERQELVIAAHTGTTGQWDWDALSTWDAGDLQAWGMDAELLDGWHTDAGTLREMLTVEIIGVDLHEDPRETNNMGIIGAGANVGFTFGDIMVTLPRELYQQVFDLVNDPLYPDVRAGVVRVLENGIANIGYR